MLEKDSYIFYGGNGVCRIADIRQERMFGNSQTYYVLMPVDTPGALIFVPADNRVLLSRMREIPCREAIMEMLDGLKGHELHLEKDNRLRAEQLDAILDRCDQRELLLLIHTIWTKRRELSKQNRKLCTADENALKRAEKIINGELGFALSLPPEEVPAFIAEQLSDRES